MSKRPPMIKIADGEGLAIQFNPKTREVISVRKITHDAEAAPTGRFLLQHLSLETPLIRKDPLAWSSGIKPSQSRPAPATSSTAPAKK